MKDFVMHVTLKNYYCKCVEYQQHMGQWPQNRKLVNILNDLNLMTLYPRKSGGRKGMTKGEGRGSGWCTFDFM